MAEVGLYKGKHFTEWVDTMKQLKRDDRADEAITLLSRLVDATEEDARANGYGVAPWYYEQLAIIYRKRKDPVAEVAILERFDTQIKARGKGPSALAARLRIARDLLSSAEEKPGRHRPHPRARRAERS